MRILLLGTGGYHPNERRHTACVMLPELGLVLDAGTGAFRVGRHLQTDHLDIVLTHPHLDHIVGLTYFFGLQNGDKPAHLTAHGRPETLKAVERSLFDPALFPIMILDETRELGDELTLRTGAVLKTFPLEHPGGSLGVRINCGGKSVAYVTDTTAVKPATIDQIRGVDLLIHEAYFAQSHHDWAVKTGHSTAREAATAALEAGAKRLILVHPDPRSADDSVALAEAAEVFPAVEHGQDGQEVIV